MSPASTTELSPKKLKREVARRRTFAIISHPDAGKTTLTEKLLLYGGALHLAGSVKSRRAAKHAVSDWMEMEQQRGISITSSVLQFEYKKHFINLLDTPGHADFSEDTYRTLAAADSAVMLVDVAKGVEPQTIKLFKVCSMRKMPVFTFVNKMDRYGRQPLEIIEEIETVLGIGVVPINWPIGMGKDFKGVYDRMTKEVILFDSEGTHGEAIVDAKTIQIEDPKLATILGDKGYAKLLEEIELLEIAGEPFDLEKVRNGEQSPMFFGSAMTNFGLAPFLKYFVEMAPSPEDVKNPPVSPTRPDFSGFIFKIQANMNPSHRDRIAFMRITSGRYTRDMQAHLLRENRTMKLGYPQQFMASERELVEEAYAGDILGLYDPGYFKIGDSLSTGDPVEAREIPRFSPEHFAVVELKDPLRRKQLDKGLNQLSEEGAIQVFRQPHVGNQTIVGAVGILQFEVLKHRLEHEYNVKVLLRTLGFKHARWIGGEFDEAKFERQDYTMVLKDREDLPILLLRNDWALNFVRNNEPGIKLLTNPPGTPGLEELHGKGWGF
ncbi:peptide chain release factor 3 [Bradymonas sediminis]|uniref:Peptide chain release factor 3 n=1 Tax=Bradymonas sediminis TaxID=1548548 RepID=A0A2Z4FP73_9DELT|nr:peptide chain release factor 3 [Bradymonas sediminis]AWV90682.1 peptide chain release factor 3 [Bradymonas sediminis]TDP62679.1 peptide chain release factor 3 (bRF-3) [Bradymonas sediminis]